MSDYFQANAAQVHPLWREGASGLRRGQLGALWALSARFTVEAAPFQAVLPTGVGKTAVMTLLPFAVPTTRVLVVAPSKLVRDQIAEEFAQLAILRDTGTAAEGMPPPKVHTVKHRVASAAEWEEFREFDVVTGTTSCLSPALEGVAAAPADLFDLLILDEAHHAAAHTWAELLQRFTGTRAALLTATPFRRDRQGLPGLIAYTYPISMAIDEGVYQRIDFVPVTVAPHEDRDLILAARAAERLNDPVHQAARSALLIRTDRKDDAERLVDVYDSVGVPLGVVHSGHSLRYVKRTIRDLEERRIRGVASVGILGEGFNLPRLKIAVYHRRHRSLPATLQFVGRIARVRDDASGPAELVAVSAQVQDETRQLYEEDASWSELIPRLAQAAIEEEQARRVYLEEFPHPSEELSLHALQPQKEARVFELRDENPDLTVEHHLIGGAQVLYQGHDDDGDLLVVVTGYDSRPRWLRSAALIERTFDLHLVVADRANGLLFVSTPSDATAKEILAAVGIEHAEGASPQAMNQLLWGVNVQAYSAIGMRSTMAPGGRQPSYQTMAGNEVNLAVLPGDARRFGVGHLIARYMDEENHLRVIGITTRRSKTWSTDATSLLGYKQWCQEISRLIRAGRALHQNAPLIGLLMPERLRTFPEHPVAAILHHSLIDRGVIVTLPNQPPVDVSTLDVEVERLDEETCRVSFIGDTGTSVAFTLDATGAMTPDGDDVPTLLPGDPERAVPLSQVITEYPITVYFADGSASRGNVINRLPADLPGVPGDVLSSWEWVGTDIETEAGPTPDGVLNVQRRTRQWMEEEWPGAFVLIDDGPCELADLLAVVVSDDRVELHLAHCKASSEPTPGQRVDDLYEIVGQAIRSARWMHPRLIWPELRKRLQKRPALQVLRGDRDALVALVDTWTEDPPRTSCSVHMIQPGLHVVGIPRQPRVNAMLLSTVDWVRAQGAELQIVGSVSS